MVSLTLDEVGGCPEMCIKSQPHCTSSHNSTVSQK